MVKIIVDRNIEVLSKTKLDNVRLEYGEIVNSSEISNRYEIDNVWNQSDDGISPKTKRRKSNKNLLADDDRSIMVSSKSSNERDNDFPHHQQKLNVSLNLCHEENTKKLDYYLVGKKPEPWDYSEPSAVVH